MKFTSGSSTKTKKIAKELADKILKSKPHQKHAQVVGLVGDLGAGKTTFTQGFAKALGVKNRMISPTFLIFRNYKLKTKKYSGFYHADVYRVYKKQDLKTIGFDKVLKNPENIVVIEWADKIRRSLPKDTIWVEFRHGRKETERFIAHRR